MTIKGKIVAAGIVEGRKDIVAVNMQFDEKLVSLTYKMHINGFLQQQRKIKVSAADQLAQQRAKMQSAKKLEDEAKDGKTAEAKTEEAKAESQTEEAAENQTEENPASEAAPAETSPASEAKAAGDAEPAPEAAE